MRMQNESPGWPFAHEHGALLQPAPIAQAHQLPQRHVVKIGKEGQLAQAAEALGFGVLRALARQVAVGVEQGLGKVAPGGKAVGRLLGQGAQQHRVHMPGQRGAQQARGRGLFVADLVERGEVGFAIEGAAAREQLIHHDGQREHVAVVRQIFLAHLLGRHVRGRAHHARELRGIAAQRQRGAEVGELDVAVGGQHQVGGLDVAVYQALAVGVFERIAALEGDVQHLGHGQQRIGPGMGRQGLAVHVFEHQVGLGGVLVGVEQTHDVGVLEPAGHGRLVAQQAAVALGLVGLGQQVGVHLLDGHALATEPVEPQVHDAAGAAPERALDAVLADGRGDEGGRGGHGHPGGDGLIVAKAADCNRVPPAQPWLFARRQRSTVCRPLFRF